MTHKLKLLIGDWSHDGHGQSETSILESNLTKEEIDAAYRAGSEKLGFDFCDTCCRRYEDSTVPLDKAHKLILLGAGEIFENAAEEFEMDNQGYVIGREFFSQIFLFVVKLGNPEFQGQIVDDDMPSLAIGGYGLFWN